MSFLASMSSDSKYLPTSTPSSSSSDSASTKYLQERFIRDKRFNPPPPSPWKRVALVLFVIALFWLAIRMRPARQVQPTVIHADRYSREHKYRPAASPIITETLKDGRIRLRGANL